jgi:hypothetical protein
MTRHGRASYNAPRATGVCETNDKLGQLVRLGALKAQGVLTEEEFEAQKQQILGT